MPNRVTIEVQYNNFPRIAAALPREVGKIVNATLLQIESRAKINCPVDTGALRASIHTEMETETSGMVGTNIEYAAPVEFGHHTRSGSFVGAQPYMTPAAEGERPRFMAEMQRLEGLLT